jgi:streptogramin lyase
VANCFASDSGVSANVVRVDSKTLEFETTWRVPGGTGFFKGITYGGGSLWVADVSGAVEYQGVTRIDPRTGTQRRVRLDRHANSLAWSEGYGDLWMTNFNRGSVSRLDPESGAVRMFESIATNPGTLVVQGDAVWVGDWANPRVVRVPAIGSEAPRQVALPTNVRPAGVTAVAAGAGGVWATAPDTRALWRIDPKTNRATGIAMRYYPWGVAVGDDGVWVTVRGEDVLP